MENIQLVIDAFISTIETKLNIDKTVLQKLWKQTNKELEKTKVPIETEKKEEIKEKEKKNTSSLVCPYVFSKGQNQGKMCGKKSKNGEEYCSLHRKKGETTKRSSTVSNSSVKSSDTTVSKSEVILKKYGDDGKHLIHSETQFIFDRSTKSVIGRLYKNKIVPLTLDDQESCNKWRFKVFEPPKEEEQEISDLEIEEENNDSVNTNVKKVLGI